PFAKCGFINLDLLIASSCVFLAVLMSVSCSWPESGSDRIRSSASSLAFKSHRPMRMPLPMRQGLRAHYVANRLGRPAGSTVPFRPPEAGRWPETMLCRVLRKPSTRCYSFCSYGFPSGPAAFAVSRTSEWLPAVCSNKRAAGADLDGSALGASLPFLVNGAPLSDPTPKGTIPQKTGPPHWNRLYHQKRDGTFEDVTEKAGLQGWGYGMGVAAGDYDNDGNADLFVTAYGGNRLYHNNGDGTFTDVTEKAGLRGSGWSTSVAWVDLDNDGLLDLIVLRYM